MTVAFSEALPLGEESASFLNPSIFFLCFGNILFEITSQFFTVLDEMWEGAKFRRIERAFFPPYQGGDTEGGV